MNRWKAIRQASGYKGMVQDPKGTWIKYDDHLAEMEKLQAQLTAITKDRDEYAQELLASDKILDDRHQRNMDLAHKLDSVSVREVLKDKLLGRMSVMIATRNGLLSKARELLNSAHMSTAPNRESHPWHEARRAFIAALEKLNED